MDVNDKMGQAGSSWSDVAMQSEEVVKSSRLSITWPRVNLTIKCIQLRVCFEEVSNELTKYSDSQGRSWQHLSDISQPVVVHLTDNAPLPMLEVLPDEEDLPTQRSGSIASHHAIAKDGRESFLSCTSPNATVDWSVPLLGCSSQLPSEGQTRRRCLRGEARFSAEPSRLLVALAEGRRNSKNWQPPTRHAQHVMQLTMLDELSLWNWSV